MTLSYRLTCLARGAALLFGAVIVVVGVPFGLLGSAIPGDTVPDWSPLLTVPLTVLLLGGGFLYVGMFGHRLAVSWRRRALAALLLAPPLAAGMAISLMPGHPEMMPFAGLLLMPAGLLFLCAIWPLRFGQAS
jgi:hypothetical protein